MESVLERAYVDLSLHMLELSKVRIGLETYRRYEMNTVVAGQMGAASIAMQVLEVPRSPGWAKRPFFSFEMRKHTVSKSDAARGALSAPRRKIARGWL